MYGVFLLLSIDSNNYPLRVVKVQELRVFFQYTFVALPCDIYTLMTCVSIPNNVILGKLCLFILGT